MDDTVWDMSRWNNRTSSFCRKGHTLSVSECAIDSLMEYLMMSHYTTKQHAPLHLQRNRLHYIYDATRSFNRVEHYRITHSACSDLTEILINTLDEEQSNGHQGHQTSQSSIPYFGSIWILLSQAFKQLKDYSKMECNRVKKRTHKGAASCADKIKCPYNLL